MVKYVGVLRNATVAPPTHKLAASQPSGALGRDRERKRSEKEIDAKFAVMDGIRGETCAAIAAAKLLRTRVSTKLTRWLVRERACVPASHRQLLAPRMHGVGHF